MNAVTKWPKTLWLILAMALGVRLLGAWVGNLTFDESAHLALAETIDLHPQRLHLVWRSLDHPLLSIYLLKLSGLLFGESNFGLRVMHVLIGSATVVPVFLLGRIAAGERAGLLAAALLAVDQFHASWSRLFMPEVVMLFFWSMGLLWTVRIATDGRTRDFILLGVWFGLAYLGKETGFLLVIVAWILLLSHRETWKTLTDWRWYLAHLVAIGCVAPDLIWNLMHFSESYLKRNAELVSETFRLQLKPLSLYLGEWFRAMIDENVLDLDYEEGNAYCCYWPAGALYLGAVIYSVRWLKQLPQRLLFTGFSVPFLFFLLLPGGERFDPFWWASASLISSVVLAGCGLGQWTQRSRLRLAIAVLLLAWLFAHYLHLAVRPGGPEGQGYPRTTVDRLAENATRDAREAILQNDLKQAKRSLVYALNVGGLNSEVLYLLAHVCRTERDDFAAERYLHKCLELQPDHERAKRMLEEIRSRTQRTSAHQ